MFTSLPLPLSIFVEDEEAGIAECNLCGVIDLALFGRGIDVEMGGLYCVSMGVEQHLYLVLKTRFQDRVHPSGMFLSENKTRNMWSDRSQKGRAPALPERLYIAMCQESSRGNFLSLHPQPYTGTPSVLWLHHRL